MTVSSEINRKRYAGDGTTTVFPFSVPFDANADLKVLFVDSDGVEDEQVLDTEFSVSGAGDPSGGSVTFVTPPPVGQDVLIVRDPALIQATDYVNNGSLPADTLESNFDKLTMIAQRTRELITRSLHAPDGDTAVDMTLPPKADRASKYAAYDADGEPIASAGPTGDSSIPVSAFGETLLDDADAAAARATLAAAGTDDANTFTKTQTWAKGDDVASAAALALGDGNYFDVTGTTSITSIGTKGIGTVVKLHFDGALTLTHHATNLVLPGGNNITTVAGDEAEFVEYAAGDWRCTNYSRPVATAAQVRAQSSSAVLLTPASLAQRVCFLAHKNGTDQTGIVTDVDTKLTFSTTDFNVGGYFDTATGRFTPPAGKYRLSGQALFSAGVVDQQQYRAVLYKKGLNIRQNVSVASGATIITAEVTCTVDADGTDYFELYAFGLGAGNKTVSGSEINTWFCGEAI